MYSEERKGREDKFKSALSCGIFFFLDCNFTVIV